MDFDFSLFLLVATLVTGVIWGAYCLVLKAKGETFNEDTQPLLVEYARSFFPVLLIVLVLRSFLAEPFRIPSGSMMPTLLVGDFILVNKFTYGIRMPAFNNKLIAMGSPQRGDIVVFRYPKDPRVNYIKRVIGLPGDRVEYHDKQLRINGEIIRQQALGVYQGLGQSADMNGAEQLLEDLHGVRHDILIRPDAHSVEFTYVVPQGQYFVMGDNRDNSNDSRYWGTVPEANLVGRAFFIWMNWDWEAHGIGINRIGTILN